MAANGTEIPYKGWAELDFRIPNNQSDINVIKVPFLVTAESIDMPIIGFNVIKKIVSNDSTDNPDFESCFSKMFVNAKPKNAEALISLIRTITTEDKLGSVKTSKRDCVIPKNKTVEVPCRANLSLNEKQTPVIFEPHVNPDVLDGLSVTEAQASYGKGPDYFWLKTAIFPVSVFLLLFSMKFGTELENYQYDSFK